MIKKTENCLYCGEKMESKTAKKKFCSALHRVYWNRENKIKGMPPVSKKETKKVASENMSRIDKLLWESEQEVLNQNKK